MGKGPLDQANLTDIHNLKVSLWACGWFLGESLLRRMSWCFKSKIPPLDPLEDVENGADPLSSDLFRRVHLVFLSDRCRRNASHPTGRMMATSCRLAELRTAPRPLYREFYGVSQRSVCHGHLHPVRCTGSRYEGSLFIKHFHVQAQCAEGQLGCTPFLLSFTGLRWGS